MERRQFIKSTALSVLAVSIPGFIRFNGEKYVGDCETTTDILGPFYRANAPVRNDLRIPEAGGSPAVLSGTVYNKDCTTPLAGARVEIWHCGPDEKYDNTSDEFRYRGTAYSDEKGTYYFRTIIPVPYKNGNTYRPAHYHMLISAPEYQDLVTQLYFVGDPYLTTDPYSSSPAAQKRILEIGKNANGEKSVNFDITMMAQLPADPAAIDRLSGVYTDVKNDKLKPEIFRRDKELWVRFQGDEYVYYYIGNNTFHEYGTKSTLQFEIRADGSVKVTATDYSDKGEKIVNAAIKSK
jgi:catechol 1,2-dioxygenase